jgi:hypothetical protein
VNKTNAVESGAFLIGAIGVGLAGGIIVGAGYLAVTGLRAAAKLFAQDAYKRLKTADEPVDIENIFDQLGVEKEVEGKRFISALSDRDANKILDLLSGERRDGINYGEFKLCRNGASILETNREGEIINNQFENPLSDPRIVSALQAALKNRSEGIPVGSKMLMDAKISEPEVQKWVGKVTAQIASVDNYQNSNSVVETLDNQAEFITEEQLAAIDRTLNFDDLPTINNLVKDLDETPIFTRLPDVEIEVAADRPAVVSRIARAEMVEDLIAVGDRITEPIFNGEEVSVIRSSVSKEAYRLSVISTPPGVTAIEAGDEAILVDQDERVLGMIPLDSPSVFLQASSTGIGDDLVEKTLINGTTGDVLMSIVVNSENDLSVNTADISIDLENKLAVALGTAAQSLEQGEEIRGALAPARAVDRQQMLSANSLQNCLHSLRDYESGDRETAIDRLNAISKDKLNNSYRFEYTGSTQKRTIACLKDGKVVCKFSSKQFKVEGKAKDRETSQGLVSSFVRDMQSAGIGATIETPVGLADTPQISEPVRIQRPTKEPSKSQSLGR